MKSVRIRVLEVLGPRVQQLRLLLLKLKGYKNISPNVVIERNVNLDRVFPQHIYIGEGCLIASSSTLLCHEHVYRDPLNADLPLLKPLVIGKRCFIGVGSVILPGVEIGDDCMIGAGTVVTKSIPSGSVAVGVPAKIIRSGIKMSDKAILIVE